MSYSLDRTKYLSKLELESLESLIKRYKNEALRDILIIEIGLKTGARASEILNIQVSDIIEETNSVLIRGIKNSRDREIPLDRDLFKRLKSLAPILDSGKNQKVFKIGYKRLQQIWNFYRPVKKGFHSLRHTFALELYTKHHNIRLCQIALGHKDIKNTIIYADYVYSVSELRKYMGGK